MRFITYISVTILALAVLVGCINNQKQRAVKNKLEKQELLAANVVGIYGGNLPCVDCDAINTVLELNRDHSYTMTYVYEGKSNDSFVKEGRWEIEKNKLILDGLDYQYRIGSEILVQLDLSGNEISGDLAERYRLSRVQ